MCSLWLGRAPCTLPQDRLFPTRIPHISACRLDTWELIPFPSEVGGSKEVPSSMSPRREAAPQGLSADSGPLSNQIQFKITHPVVTHRVRTSGNKPTPRTLVWSAWYLVLVQ